MKHALALTTPRLTEGVVCPPDRFDRCRLCGRAELDVVELVLYQECDLWDKPEPRFLLACRGKACLRCIDDHPRLYVSLNAQAGGPGHWRLICDDCDHRRGFSCAHPYLKANGGPGLEVKHSGMSGFACGSGGCRQIHPTAYRCTGKTVEEKPA